MDLTLIENLKPLPKVTSTTRALGYRDAEGNGKLPADSPRGWRVNGKTFTREEAAREYADLIDQPMEVIR